MSNPNHGKWIASIDSEEGWSDDYVYNTRDEAINNAPNDLNLNLDYHYFWTGQIDSLSLEELPLYRVFDAEWILDQITDLAEDEWGIDDDKLFNHVSHNSLKDLEARLVKTFINWINDHNQDTDHFYVDNIKEHKVNKDTINEQDLGSGS